MAQVVIEGKSYEAREGERLAEALRRFGFAVPLPCGGRGSCGKCRVTVDGRAELACQYEIHSDITVALPERETIVSETGARASGHLTERSALALDIGTTTLALALVSLDDKTIVRVVTRPNPQRAYGADVMSRVGHCMAHGPVGLQLAVMGAVNEMRRELGAPVVETLYAAGNTAMLHLFFGVDCSSMGAAPYTPAFLAEKTASGESLGLPGVKNVVSLPGAAAFVGADLTAGLNYVGFPPPGKYRLLIDLGTNAEVVLFSRETALCTAAAAGPCFEGANISCGMSASPGAVCAFDAAGYRTIGDEPAKGLCGTGLVDVIAALLADETIDETGFMECEEYEIAPSVTLTQGDVRQYQLAKSAVCSAVQTLVRRLGIGFDDIDALYLSGGFSAKINVARAAATGLLPPELRDRCVAVNNSSLLGTVRYACEKNDLSAYLHHLRYVDLAADPVFSERFIENMTF